ncbi:MAG: response regulator transcription factor [Pseudaminobacter sp.]
MITASTATTHYNHINDISDAAAPIVMPPGEPKTRAMQWEQSLVIVDSRALGRQCLTQSLRASGICLDVVAVGSMEEWRGLEAQHPPLSAILVNVGGRRITDPDITEDITRLVSKFHSVPVIVLADNDDLTQILKALECGARGYIPSSVGIEICAEAISLALAGGTFVPASSIVAMKSAINNGMQETNPILSMFTPRQAEVANALRRGKANKIIAYELDLHESTVKVHIRNIMRKLKATNRTEVAYKINDLFPLDTRS